MFSEKTRLIEKRENPFYGSYKEHNVLEEIHWQNRRKKRQLAIVAAVIIILVTLSIGITLAITLPPLLEKRANSTLDPVDPTTLLAPSPSVLGQYTESGVTSESEICSNIGNEVLQKRNGSAVDAAVAVTLCIGVTSPQSSGLGGGMFMTIYSEDQMFALNARETVPADVETQIYNDDPSASVKGGLAVGVPGELAGLWEAHQKFGKVEWADLVKFATDLALNGFLVSSQLAKSLKTHANKIKADPVLSSEFLNPITGDVWLEGDMIQRPRLASTLQSLEQTGIEGFYNGTTASNIVADVGDAKGVISADDLSSYRVEWVDPITYKFSNNLTMFTLPFPSSGPVVGFALFMLDGFGKMGLSGMTPIEVGLDSHHLAEVLKFAAVHRAQISDPNFTNTSQLLDKLLSQEYAEELRARIDPYKTFDDPRHYGGVFAQPHDSGTAHISIIGPDGDAVSLTTTINLGFGAGFMGNSTGIIFNNEIDDFSFENVTDAYGLGANENNFVEPGKRPASSMAPVIFLNRQGQPVLVTGGSGGSKIVAAVISATWKALYRELDIKKAIDYPRFMPNFNSAELLYEYGLTKSVVAELERRGHRMKRIPTTDYLGNVNSVCRTKRDGIILANADYRKRGGSAGF